MINMKNKKFITLIFIFIFSLFAFIDNVSATKIKGKFLNPSGYGGATYYLKGVTAERALNGIGFFMIGNNQAYCLEPGVRLNSTGYENNNNYVALSSVSYSDSKFLKDSTEKRKLVAWILTFAYKGSEPSASNFPKYAAAQALIWEVVTGERTSFSSLKPNKTISSDSSKNKKNLYSVIHSSSATTNTKKIAKEYDAIVKAIQGTFLKEPGETGKKFSSDSTAQSKKIVLTWDSKIGKYSIDINDKNFKYWKVIEKSGLEVKKSNDKITIMSSTAIDENSAKKIGIAIDSSNDIGAAQIYKDGSYQDVVSIKGTTSEKFVYVYTPKFQLQITKQETLNANKKLPDVSFYICTKEACDKSSRLAIITTNSAGVATYTNLPNPGKYFIKETAQVEGYEKNSSPYVINVTTDNVAGTKSFAKITIKNKNKKFQLIKRTKDQDGNITILNDGCGTDTYTGPEFEIYENGNLQYFKEISPGKYDVSKSNETGSTSRLKTCNGAFDVYTLPKCKYTIKEVKAPEGLTLPADSTRTVDACQADAKVEFLNGFAGLEFHKKNEDGAYISGGKFSIQKKENNIYRDILLLENERGFYEYVEGLKEEDSNATYIFKTINDSENGEVGKAYIEKLPPGEYRIVEKEAPEGYELIKDKDSTAIVTIKETTNEIGHYFAELINKKAKKSGSEAFAELIVTITTGRKIPNYVLIISILTALLVIVVIIRKKIRK